MSDSADSLEHGLPLGKFRSVEIEASNVQNSALNASNPSCVQDQFNVNQLTEYIKAVRTSIQQHKWHHYTFAMCQFDNSPNKLAVARHFFDRTCPRSLSRLIL
jgi:hypothetical protein